MKPKDLKSPFSWENRHILLQDQILFVPDYFSDYHTFTFPGFDHPAIFGNNHPVMVEFCSGNGSWLIDQAIENPQFNWVAVEKRFDRARKIYSKIKNARLKNVFIICGEALTCSQHYIPKNSVKECFINFPDPWPKERHFKHRLVKAEFALEVKRMLQEGGAITLVTDDTEYRKVMIDVFRNSPDFESLFPEPYYIFNWESYGTSFFDELWRQKGKKIHFIKFRKVGAPVASLIS